MHPERDTMEADVEHFFQKHQSTGLFSGGPTRLSFLKFCQDDKKPAPRGGFLPCSRSGRLQSSASTR